MSSPRGSRAPRCRRQIALRLRAPWSPPSRSCSRRRKRTLGTPALANARELFQREKLVPLAGHPAFRMLRGDEEYSAYELRIYPLPEGRELLVGVFKDQRRGRPDRAFRITIPPALRTGKG